MERKNTFPLAMIVSFLWVGFVCAISFMEAWLKFRAPHVTLPIGLGIGRLVFGAMNKVEWFFALLVLADILWKRVHLDMRNSSFLYSALFLLLVQSFYLMPLLNERISIIVAGGTPAPSLVHWYYVVAEVLKLSSLFIFGCKLFYFYLKQRDLETLFSN